MQWTEFPQDVKAWTDGGAIPNTSRLIRMMPRMDDDKVLRLSGRLDNAQLELDEKHPVILSARHPFVNLMIQQAHFQLLHGGKQLIMTVLRQKFWFIGLASAVKYFVTKKCSTCIKNAKPATQQLMGTLPAVRFYPAPPFSRMGVDYAGPFLLRKTEPARNRAQASTNHPTPIKVWVVVFARISSRAIHLEVVRSLQVESFLEALARMNERRGMTVEIWSDNATTFVGSDNELQRVMKAWGDDFPHQQLSELGTTWRFITPAASHQGGIREAAVKSMKHHLTRVMGNRTLAHDQFYLLVIQVEACLNARPLFPRSENPTDLNPITPAHLVIGRSTHQRIFTEDLTAIAGNRLTLWGLQQKLYCDFWKRFKEEHLRSIQVRNKWYEPRKNRKHEKTPPSVWPLVRVETVHPGPDGLVRSAGVIVATTKRNEKTGKSEIVEKSFERPIQKLCVLLPDEMLPPHPSTRSTSD